MKSIVDLLVFPDFDEHSELNKNMFCEKAPAQISLIEYRESPKSRPRGKTYHTKALSTGAIVPVLDITGDKLSYEEGSLNPNDIISNLRVTEIFIPLGEGFEYGLVGTKGVFKSVKASESVVPPSLLFMKLEGHNVKVTSSTKTIEHKRSEQLFDLLGRFEAHLEIDLHLVYNPINGSVKCITDRIVIGSLIDKNKGIQELNKRHKAYKVLQEKLDEINDSDFGYNLLATRTVTFEDKKPSKPVEKKPVESIKKVKKTVPKASSKAPEVATVETPVEIPKKLMIVPYNDGSSTKSVLFYDYKPKRKMNLENYPTDGLNTEIDVEFFSFHREVNILDLSYRQELADLGLITSDDKVSKEVLLKLIMLEIKGESKVYSLPESIDFVFKVSDNNVNILELNVLVWITVENNKNAVVIDGTLDVRNGHMKLNATSTDPLIKPVGYFPVAYRI